jgi:hypothetical protein
MVLVYPLFFLLSSTSTGIRYEESTPAWKVWGRLVALRLTFCRGISQNHAPSFVIGRCHWNKWFSWVGLTMNECRLFNLMALRTMRYTILGTQEIFDLRAQIWCRSSLQNQQSCITLHSPKHSHNSEVLK